MSIRIALDNRPEFYTNLDFVKGRIILGLNRSEQIGSIVVKLEGESVTALQSQNNYNPPGAYKNSYSSADNGPSGSLATENHKILYKIQQVFPDEYHATSSNPYGSYPLNSGEHVFPFKFKLPVNNACSDPVAMSQLGGIAGSGGYAAGTGLFGIGGVRVMDGSKQLMLRHVTRTLPPSLTGFPMEAEIRYYIKVTIQRPGFLKENWRYQIGLKFLPIEPPRPEQTGQEAFARRPFAFRPRSPSQFDRKMSFFSKKPSKSSTSNSIDGINSGEIAPAPSIEMSARLPHPSVLTCNKPIPLRLLAKRLNNNPDEVYLTSFQMDLVGITEIRCHSFGNKKVNRWVIVSNTDLSIPLAPPGGDPPKEVEVSDLLWKNRALPNTVAPSFVTCNLSRRYEIELKLGVSWGKPKSSPQPQVIYLPLHLAKIDIFSGISPPAPLLQTAHASRRASKSRPTRTNGTNGTNGAPQLPPRNPSVSTNGHLPMPAQPPIQDPLYPPQLVPGQMEPPYDDAPPSYDEAVAENLAGPFDGLQSRPAYSGVTNEDAPSQMPPEKN